MSKIATKFLMMAIQEWGQSDSERVTAVQDLLNAAKFDAVATCAPVFGGIWPTLCTGPDADTATVWLKEMTNTMPRGKFEREVEHIERFIEQRIAKVEGHS